MLRNHAHEFSEHHRSVYAIRKCQALGVSLPAVAIFAPPMIVICDGRSVAPARFTLERYRPAERAPRLVDRLPTFQAPQQDQRIQSCACNRPARRQLCRTCPLQTKVRFYGTFTYVRYQRLLARMALQCSG
jgi:hypothetical protein